MTDIQEGFFRAKDGIRLFEQSWRIENSKAVVLIAHGFAEHCNRYTPIAAYLNQNGFSVTTFDLRGHGRSEGERCYVETFDDYLTDLHLALLRVRGLWPDMPIFLIGHSMGGLIAPLYVLREKAQINGLILSAPLIRLGRDYPSVNEQITYALGKILPRFPTVRVRSKSLSHDPDVVKKYEADRHVYHRKTPARTAAEIKRAVREIRRRMEEIRLPLLILHGDGDCVTDVQGSRELYARAGSADKLLKVYEGLYHELMSEPEKEQILNEITSWLNARV